MKVYKYDMKKKSCNILLSVDVLSAPIHTITLFLTYELVMPNIRIIFPFSFY